jgi:diamine N-acetyltransferase
LVIASQLNLRRAIEADIASIMMIERTPGYEQLVGRWDGAQHRNALADSRHAYFIAQDLVAQDRAERPVGFAIVRDWASPEQVTLIKRVAVSHPGLGYGRALVRNVVDAIFRETDAHRIWLGVFPENIRAQCAYEAVGFRREGIARGTAFFNGVHRDELVMALLRPQWSSGKTAK